MAAKRAARIAARYTNSRANCPRGITDMLGDRWNVGAYSCISHICCRVSLHFARPAIRLMTENSRHQRQLGRRLHADAADADAPQATPPGCRIDVLAPPWTENCCARCRKYMKSSSTRSRTAPCNWQRGTGSASNCAPRITTRPSCCPTHGNPHSCRSSRISRCAPVLSANRAISCSTMRESSTNKSCR